MYRSPIARLAHVRCAYGGTGVSPVGYCAIMVYFDVAAVFELSGLAVTDVELVDARGESLGRAGPPISLAVSLPGRDRDHNEITAPFGGAVDAGATIRLRAGTELSALPGVLSSCRYRATIVATSAGETTALTLEGPLSDPWPMAGPSVLRPGQ